jgi:hypothetical protein
MKKKYKLVVDAVVEVVVVEILDAKIFKRI